MLNTKQIEFYKNNGYLIIKNAIDTDLIDNFNASVNNVIDKKKLNHWHTQNTHIYKKLSRNSEGFLEDSLQSPHAYCWSKSFRKNITKIICNASIVNMINDLSKDKSDYAIWQSMYFDKSTGTLGHQDSYYLDTLEPGGVVGCWFALEDINPECGPFYVIPKSHKSGLLYDNSKEGERYANHDEYVKKMKNYEKVNKKNIVPIVINKGDILLWHSLTFHGSLKNTNKHLSRKSLTCHFFPLNKKIKYHKSIPNVIKPFDLNVPIMGYPTFFQNFKVQVKTVIQLLKDFIFGKSITLDMRRKSYE